MTRPVRTDFIARDKTSAVVDRIAGKTEGMGSKFVAIGKRIGAAMATASVAVGGFAVAGAVMGVKTAASLEQAKIAFESLLGSGKKADKFLKDLSKFASATPFELPGLIDSSRQLIGVGQSAKTVIPTLRAWGDAAGALGLGQEQFNRIMLAVTQSMSKGKVQAEELMQITEAGVPIWPLLAKAMGKSVPQLQELASKGELLAKDVFPALEKQMAKDYGGAMGKQAQTLTGLWSTFMDTLNIGLAEAVQPLLPVLKKGLGGAISSVGDALKKIPGWVESAQKVWDKLKLRLPKVDWSKLGDGIGKAASGWGSNIVAGFKAAVDKGDWGAFGKSLGKAINDALTKVGDLSKGFGKWVAGIDWVEVGKKIGGKAIGFAIGFLAGLGDELFTAEFWKKHWWDVIVGVLSIIPIGKLLGVLGKVFARIPILKAFSPMFAKMDKLADFLWKPIWAALRWVGRRLLGAFKLLFPNASKGLKGFFDLLFTRIGVWGLELGAKARALAGKFVGGINRGIERGIAFVVRMIGKTIMFMLKPFIGAGKWLFKRGWQLIRGLMAGVGRAAARLGSWLRDKIWKPIDRVLDRVRGAFSRGVTRIGQVWNKLRDKTRRPVNFMIDVVYNKGIRRLWNRINNLWGGRDLSPIKFAGGGVLPGYAPGRDSVPAVLSPGEGILRPEVVRQLGSATILAWNKAAKTGKPIHAFADGGVVGLLKRAGGGLMDLFSSPAKMLRKVFSGVLGKMDRFRGTAFGRGVARIPGRIVDKLIGKAKGLLDGGLGFLGRDQSQSVKAIMAVARSFHPGARLTSGVRNTPDYHGRGLAADIVGGGFSGMAKIARGFYRVSGRLLELIHSGGGGYFVKHGRRVGSGFYGNEVANHWDHVHVAARRDALAGLYDKGGQLPPGVSTVVNRTGRPEAVLTNAQWSAVLAHLMQSPEIKVTAGDNSKVAAFIVAVLREFVKSRGGNVQKAITGKAAA